MVSPMFRRDDPADVRQRFEGAQRRVVSEAAMPFRSARTSGVAIPHSAAICVRGWACGPGYTPEPRWGSATCRPCGPSRGLGAEQLGPVCGGSIPRFARVDSRNMVAVPRNVRAGPRNVWVQPRNVAVFRGWVRTNRGLDEPIRGMSSSNREISPYFAVGSIHSAVGSAQTAVWTSQFAECPRHFAEYRRISRLGPDISRLGP